MSNFKLNPKFKFCMFYVENMQSFWSETQSNIQLFWMFNTEYQTQSNIQFFKYLISHIWQIKFKFWIDLVFGNSRLKKKLDSDSKVEYWIWHSIFEI